MTWLITGGSGQLGLAISRELKIREIIYNAASSKELDITQPENIRRVIRENSPEVIVNCAAWTDVDGAESNENLAFQVNSYGAEKIAEAAMECSAKLIHVSTDYVFSGNATEPRKEDDKTNPESAYGRTKSEGENRILKCYPQNSSIVRTAWLYSPWSKNFAKTIVKQLLTKNEEIRVVNDQVGQPTSAEDLAKQIVNLGLSNSPSATYHGTNSGQATWFEFAQEIAKLVGADARRVIPVKSDQYSRPAIRPRYSVLSHDTWKLTTITPMRDWRIALSSAMPAIVSAVNAEG